MHLVQIELRFDRGGRGFQLNDKTMHRFVREVIARRYLHASELGRSQARVQKMDNSADLRGPFVLIVTSPIRRVLVSVCACVAMNFISPYELHPSPRRPFSIPKLEEAVLSCIEADFCNQILF